jgi:prevent-host-death family protein
MKSLTATEFKAKCLKIIDHLGSEGILITKRGHPVAKIVPVGIKKIHSLYGSMKEKTLVHGDINSTGLKWNAES